ncbi:protein SGT1 homolog isoform X2 [Gadus macrocephalus]|uniref:protein SGT1 homolog isoform X2 n=1 Tax=Gadus macrocephalus TaxID=80720 RepID=UPI0028CB802C|nr:protein SGT1 homolog isoform X2 [Gadus macrocephalus]
MACLQCDVQKHKLKLTQHPLLPLRTLTPALYAPCACERAVSLRPLHERSVPPRLPRWLLSSLHQNHPEQQSQKDSSDRTDQQTTTPPPVKYDWYQTESQVIVTIMAKNVPKDGVSVNFAERGLSATVPLTSGDNFSLDLHLLHPIVSQQSTFKVLTTKVEIKMKKMEAIRWEKLEGEGQEPTIKHFNPNEIPSSSQSVGKWDKMVVDISEEEKQEKLEGDAALNKLFQQIYSDGSDEVKRAMNKSFMESGGTVLSTNWTDVGKRNVDISPPDDAEFKKY